MKISKRGSYIMEASVVLPVIILAVVTSVLVIMFFCSQMTDRSRMHIELRSEAGEITKKTYYQHKKNLDGEIYKEKKGSYGEIYGKKYLIMENKGLLDKKGIFVVEDKCCFVDATQYVRYCNIVKGEADE